MNARSKKKLGRITRHLPIKQAETRNDFLLFYAKGLWTLMRFLHCSCLTEVVIEYSSK